ncbi:MAG: sulfotransferase [Lachnospiraceae bacterium]|nr:sulfotransferase [Lachnospiraceae bacterium]
MTEQEEMLCIRETIDTAVKDGCDKFVIVPYGRFGAMAKDILNNEYKIDESFIVDNFKYDNKTIFKLDDLPLDKSLSYCFIIVSKDYIGMEFRTKIEDKYGDNSKIYKVEYLSDEQKEICNSSDKLKLDFFCCGFGKCGTTSLDNALKSNPNIFLPEMKETMFLSRMNKVGVRLLKKCFKESETAGKVVGEIYPHAAVYPERAYRYYGADTKIIFMVRNLYSAISSMFMWDVQLFGNKKNMHIFEENDGHVDATMFKHWLEEGSNRNLKVYNYNSIIREWIYYFGRDNVKIVLSEDLFANTKEVMDDVQRFIGLEESKIVDISEFPHSNSNGRVSKDLHSSMVYSKIVDAMNLAIYNFPETFNDFTKIRNEVWEEISVPFDRKSLLTEENKKIIWDYYEAEIHGLEELLDRSLEGIWY